MKYMYQDSTELPVQRDYIEDLKVFIKTIAKVIPLENSIIEIKNRNREMLLVLEKKLNELRLFEERFYSQVQRLSQEINSEELGACIEAVLETCSLHIGQKCEILESEASKIKRGSVQECQKYEIKILEALSEFLISGVYRTEKNFEILSKGDSLSAKMRGAMAGLQYRYDLELIDEVLTVEKLFGKLSLPTWTKTGLIRKEEKIKMQDLSDFFITSLECDSLDNVRLVLENKKASHKFKIEGGDSRYFIYDEAQEISADKELSGLIDQHSLALLPENIRAYFRENIRAYSLEKVMLDEEDAVAENQVFDCLKIIAEQYGTILQECLEKGNNKDEIIIKVEESDGRRTEKYLSREEVYRQLADIGSEGVEIAGILGIDTRVQVKESNYLIV
ncbi:MAG: chromosome segregation ATPase [Methanosarcinaceae archaeon]|nr:chromosome segregation ATPase [Methanosarcinaceae archaeon]